MTFRTHSLLKSRKAQFFVLSAFAIVTVIYFISRWVEPYTIVDTSAVVLMEEPFIFNNVKEKAVATVNESRSCEDFDYDLEEYKNFVESYAFEKNLKLNFDYDVSPCFPPVFPIVAAIRMSLQSPVFMANSSFTVLCDDVHQCRLE